MSNIAFVLVTIVTLTAAFAAATLTRLMHAALSLVVVFLGLAVLYVLLGAEFVGLVQIFVYVGAVAVLIVFTILLTRRDRAADRFNWGGLVIALAVFGGLLWAILRTSFFTTVPTREQLTVKTIGQLLMTDYVWPLQCVGLVLTVALLGALILAMEERP